MCKSRCGKPRSRPANPDNGLSQRRGLPCPDAPSLTVALPSLVRPVHPASPRTPSAAENPRDQESARGRQTGPPPVSANEVFSEHARARSRMALPAPPCPPGQTKHLRRRPPGPECRRPRGASRRRLASVTVCRGGGGARPGSATEGSASGGDQPRVSIKDKGLGSAPNKRYGQSSPRSGSRTVDAPGPHTLLPVGTPCRAPFSTTGGIGASEPPTAGVGDTQGFRSDETSDSGRSAALQ